MTTVVPTQPLSSLSSQPPIAITAHWLDKVLPTRRYVLLLDIDGTLAPFHIDPKQSAIPATTLSCLNALQALGIPIALVTGRSVAEARQLAEPLSVPIAGTHGLELFVPHTGATLPPAIDPAAVAAIQQAVRVACTIPELSIEYKPYSVALHFREYPQFASMAERIMRGVARDYPDWTLKAGKCVWEIVPKGADKGSGISQLITALGWQADCPIFIGDDVTDEAGFAVVNALGGVSIKVGSGATVAHYRLTDIDAVADWLDALLQQVRRAHHER